MAEFEYEHAGNTEAQQKEAMAWLLAQSGTPGKAAAGYLAGLLVTQTGTASGSVLVGAGAGVAQNAVLDGASILVNDTQKTLDIFTPNPMGGTPSNEIVVFDNATRTILNVVGTPNAVPTDPTVPGTAVALARLRHAASATTIPTAKIDDLRVLTGVGSSSLTARVTALEADTGWTNISMGSFSGSVVNTVQYRVLRGVLYMRGNVQNFTSGSFVTVGTIPYHPGVTSNFPVSTNSTVSMSVQVDTSGNVKAYCSGGTAAWTSFAGVIFPPA
jgi:hypothetical protein